METIDNFIKNKVQEVLSQNDGSVLPDTTDFIATDNLGEVIEKLIILHIRMWMIEDSMEAVYEDDIKIADLKRKLDICFKQKRPKFVQAINRLVESSIKHEKSLIEDSVKIYKGFEDNNV